MEFLSLPSEMIYQICLAIDDLNDLITFSLSNKRINTICLNIIIDKIKKKLETEGIMFMEKGDIILEISLIKDKNIINIDQFNLTDDITKYPWISKLQPIIDKTIYVKRRINIKFDDFDEIISNIISQGYNLKKPKKPMSGLHSSLRHYTPSRSNFVSFRRF